MNFYQLPPNAYPHDVAPAVDGAVWYSGQRLGVLGRSGEAWGGESGTDRLVVVRD